MTALFSTSANVPSGGREDDATYNNIITVLNRHKSNLNNAERQKLFATYTARIKQNMEQKKIITDMESNNTWYGDELDTNDGWCSGTNINNFRVATININRISKSLDWLEWEILIETSKRLQIDSLGITEPNINFNNNRVMLELYEKMKASDQHMQLSVSCSNQLNSTEKKRGYSIISQWQVGL